jgi:uncharacterized protein
VKLFNLTLDRVVCQRIALARTIWSRTRGLLGRPPLDRGEGLLIEPCQSVHMFFMRYAIDVVFLDHEYRVVALRPELRPWRATRYFRAAHAALELRAGAVAESGLELGHQLVLEGS